MWHRQNPSKYLVQIKPGIYKKAFGASEQISQVNSFKIANYFWCSTTSKFYDEQVPVFNDPSVELSLKQACKWFQS